MKNHEQKVFQAYAKTIRPVTGTTNDADTAFFMALRRLGKFAVPLLCSLWPWMIVSGCNNDPAGTQSTVVSASVVAPPAPHVAVNVVPGTKFRHYKLDADVTFIGQDQSGAVLTDIRVDGTQHIRATLDPSAFLTDVVANKDWSPVEPPKVNDLSVQ